MSRPAGPGVPPGEDLAMIRAKVAHIERSIVAARAAAAVTEAVREPVPGLGSVSLSPAGALLAVDLDARELAWTSPDALASAVVAAVARAEARTSFGLVRDA